MSESIFFRLLHTPIEAKGEALASHVAALNQEGEADETFTLDPAEFSRIPSSPFAYWVSKNIRQLFAKLPSVAESTISVQHGASTKDDFRFLRLWWEVLSTQIGQSLRWVLFAKGGQYSPYHADVHLMINWENDAKEIHDYLVKHYPYLKGNTGWILHPENTYFRPGLTWPRRTGGFSVRVLPTGCIFADKGPSAFVSDNDEDSLLALLAMMNSVAFGMLVRVQLARTELAQSYEIGLIQSTPIPMSDRSSLKMLARLAREAHDLQRDRDRTDETTHAFCLPGLAKHRAGSLCEAGAALEAAAQATAARLAAIQSEIDDLVFDLYGLDESDRALVHREMGEPPDADIAATDDASSADDESVTVADDEAEDESLSPILDISAQVQDLLQWCVGVAFGYWDVRKALDPTLLSPLGGPFDPLPHCAPGALVGPDGLPPDAPPQGYPLQLAWDGILVDDPTHPADLVARVRGVLALLWGKRAEAVEREACGILGVKNLRDYFRDARQGFFTWHIKRYSKSRRKAPLYWLLQSERRAYALWLYAHRLTPTTLFTAARSYADVKVSLEERRLAELRQGIEALAGSARRQRERGGERQQKLLGEVQAFRDRLDRIALLNLPPDLNDGILISIAPLGELVPWKEAGRMWRKLCAGEYPWSTMSQQMRQRGLIVP